MSRRSKRRKRRVARARAAVPKEAKPDSPIDRPAPGQGPANRDRRTATIPDAPANDAASLGRYVPEEGTRSALKRAKKIHEQQRTPESESLLVDAYVARIDALGRRGLIVEAKALTELVEQRYAVGPGRLADVRLAVAAREDNVAELVAGLNDPQLPPERRGAIEKVIREELTDLPGLAQCGALAPDHPLRKGAAAVLRALEAATSRTVTDEDVALPDVSRRSPLAPWKLLVRAVASFYQCEDDACRKLLDAIDADSAPGRLVPALRAMLAGEEDAGLKPAASKLAAAVVGRDTPALRQALAALDRALGAARSRKIPAAIRRAVRICEKARPGMLVRLKQRISTRCVLAGISAREVIAALGGPTLHDAYFWRLFARTVEVEGDLPHACALWEQFRRHAVHEGWFQDRGPETTAVYLHMARLLQGLAPRILRAERAHFLRAFAGVEDYYQDQPASVRAAAPKPGENPDLSFLYPERLYERICSYDADAETFERWWEQAHSRDRSGKAANEVALKWHEALPQDPRPLLRLTASAEKRKALTKALKFLQKAEALDALSPEVKRARLRLVVSKAVRHLKQDKGHLAEKDFAELAELPQAREGDRPALVAALRWAHAKLQADAPRAERCRQEAGKLLEGDLGACVLLTRVAGELGTPHRVDAPALPSGGNLAEAVTRTAAVCNELGLGFVIPREWHERLREGLSARNRPLDPALLAALGREAVRSRCPELTFYVSAAGLRQEGPHQGRFMLLRAQSLPPYPLDRRQECFAVATELARRRRDMDLVAEAIDAQRSCPGGVFPTGPDLAEVGLDEQDLARVLAREKNARKFPTFFDDGLAPDDRTRAPAFPGPRRRGRSAAPPLPTLFDEDEDDYEEDPSEWDDDLDEDELDDDELGPFGEDFGGVPFSLDDLPMDLPSPRMMEVMVEILIETGGRKPTMKDLEKIVRKNPKLRKKLMRVMEAEFDDRPPGPNRGPRPGSRSGRSGRKKKRKR